MFVVQLLSEGGEGPNTELLWVFYLLVAFLLLAIIVGWISSPRKKVEPEPTHEPPVHHVKKREVDDPAKKSKGEIHGERKK
jgi:hypothetical protein